MTRTEFIKSIRELVDKLESGNFYFGDISDDVRIFCNQHYGQIWAKVGKGITVNVDLFHESEEEKIGVKWNA